MSHTHTHIHRYTLFLKHGPGLSGFSTDFLCLAALRWQTYTHSYTPIHTQLTHTHTHFFPLLFILLSLFLDLARGRKQPATAPHVCVNVCFVRRQTLWDCVSSRLLSIRVIVCLSVPHTLITVVSISVCICWYFSVCVCVCLCLKCWRINYCDHMLKLPRMTFLKGNKAATHINNGLDSPYWTFLQFVIAQILKLYAFRYLNIDYWFQNPSVFSSNVLYSVLLLGWILPI